MIRLRRKNTVYILIAFCLFLIIFTNNIVVNSTNDTGNLRVYVTDNENNPLPGATILLVNPSTYALVYEDCSYSYQNGECFFEEVEVGYYLIKVYYSIEKPCMPPDDTLILERFVIIKENQTHYEHLRTSYPAPLSEQNWLQIIQTLGISGLIGTLLGFGGTYWLTIRKEKKDEEKREVQKKEERKEYLDLFYDELKILSENFKYINQNTRPTTKSVPIPFLKRQPTKLYVFNQLSLQTYFPLETPFYDLVSFERLKQVFSSKELLKITNIYKMIKKFNNQIEYYNKYFNAWPGENYFSNIEKINIESKIGDLRSNIKSWSKS